MNADFKRFLMISLHRAANIEEKKRIAKKIAGIGD